MQRQGEDVRSEDTPRKALMEQAMKDPPFIKDLEELESDFQFADAEAARRLDELDNCAPSP
jgi:hypothetical protein